MVFASINGVTLRHRFSAARSGVPLILVNSLGTSLEIWEGVLPLVSADRPVLAWDKRGHGLSEAPPGPCGLDDHVADLLGLAARYGLGRFDLCGISIGGMIAMRVAAQHPAKVGRLVLCDTAPTIGTAESWARRIASVRASGMGAIADAVAAGWVSPRFGAADEAAFTGWRTMLERCPPDGYIASCAAVRDADLGPELGKIVTPTLVVAGEHDSVTPPAVARALAAALANAQFREIRGAGHVPAIEQPEALAGLIREHLNEVVNA
jgi:3-oxoadipate enol-lactonase